LLFKSRLTPFFGNHQFAAGFKLVALTIKIFKIDADFP